MASRLMYGMAREKASPRCSALSTVAAARRGSLRGEPVDHDHYEAPAVLPYLGIISCAGLAVPSVTDDPKLVLWAGG